MTLCVRLYTCLFYFYILTKWPVEKNPTRPSMIISVCNFMCAGWTQPSSACHTTCSSHHRTLCNSFNSILPQSPAWQRLWYILISLVFNSWFCFDTTAGVLSWQICIWVWDDSLILLPSCTILLLTVLTTSPLVIWWTTPVCSAANLWCQQVPWDWRDRYWKKKD